ncbi:hypothetical protein NQU96_15695 [Pseudoalteromonas elyakovii]|nr:hypothetical protein [Pseudoalteromonas elyakovii]
MTINEPNHYARNLKFVSTLFILYWVLGLQPSNEEIKLAFINYQITNPGMLPWVAYSVLVYVLWGFLVSRRRTILPGLKGYICDKCSVSDVKYYKELFSNIAKKDYILNKKENFEERRLEAIQKLNEEIEIGSYEIEIHSIMRVSNRSYFYPQIYYKVIYPKTTSNQNNDVFGGYIPVPNYCLYKVLFFIKTPVLAILFFLKSEHFQDSILPIIMFFFAVVCSLLIQFGVPAPFSQV